MKHTNKKKTKRGGKVLSSGGFGCVFKPALKCKTQKLRRKNGVSKLMKKKHGAKEYGEVVKYLPQLKTIPNYQDYFLVEGFSICDPGPLEKQDLENFDVKCKALTKIGIDKENINKNLDKLSLISMPYGGMDVGDFIKSTHYKKLQALNESLQRLLIDGILQMNKKGVYHCDIKESNVLVQERGNNMKVRLIDWGLSTAYHNERKVPSVLLNRPFQYNLPFSNILFNSLFAKMYHEFLQKYPNPNFIEIRAFVINYTITWVDERGPGHLRNINGIFKKMFEGTLVNVENKFKEDIIEYNYTFYFIFEYLSRILQAFTKNAVFAEMEYFTTVFLKNIDVWGFVMIYLPTFEHLYKNETRLNPIEKEIMNTIQSMILLVMETSTEPINIVKVESFLQALNILFQKATRQRMNFSRLKTIPSSSSSKTKKISAHKSGSVIDHYYERK